MGGKSPQNRVPAPNQLPPQPRGQAKAGRQAGMGNEDAAHLQSTNRVALRLLRRDWGLHLHGGAPEGKRARGQS